ncbi:MAG: DUF2459 domain-containing protein [Pseudomonadota bacterium]|nr:DUF2459 domain-containing protein [Pseudomonadota bacterium]
MMSSGWLVLLAECFFTPMVALRQCVLFLMVIAVCGACATRVEEASDSLPHRGPSASVLLLVDRWHAGVAIRASDIPGDLMPERRDFPEAEYLEFGWGDWDFYQASSFSSGYALKALLLSTRTVLHVVGFSGPVTRYAPYREIIALNPPSHGFQHLVGYIDESFAREGRDAAVPLRRGLYGDSRFYPARGTFHLFNTCNTWAARALQAAGYPISSVITVGALVSEARRFGDALDSGPASR